MTTARGFGSRHKTLSHRGQPDVDRQAADRTCRPVLPRALSLPAWTESGMPLPIGEAAEDRLRLGTGDGAGLGIGDVPLPTMSAPPSSGIIGVQFRE